MKLSVEEKCMPHLLVFVTLTFCGQRMYVQLTMTLRCSIVGTVKKHFV